MSEDEEYHGILVDIETGLICTSERQDTLFGWSEGNNACDCNRGSEFPSDDYDDTKGCRSLRYVMVATTPAGSELLDFESFASPEDCYSANPNYPKETVDKALEMWKDTNEWRAKHE